MFNGFQGNGCGRSKPLEPLCFSQRYVPVLLPPAGPNRSVRRRPPLGPGTERFVGGTDKYKGITGKQTFQGNFIGDTGAGWSDWKGNWKLP